MREEKEERSTIEKEFPDGRRSLKIGYWLGKGTAVGSCAISSFPSPTSLHGRYGAIWRFFFGEIGERIPPASETARPSESRRKSHKTIVNYCIPGPGAQGGTVSWRTATTHRICTRHLPGREGFGVGGGLERPALGGSGSMVSGVQRAEPNKPVQLGGAIRCSDQDILTLSICRYTTTTYIYKVHCMPWSVVRIAALISHIRGLRPAQVGSQKSSLPTDNSDLNQQTIFSRMVLTVC